MDSQEQQNREDDLIIESQEEDNQKKKKDKKEKKLVQKLEQKKPIDGKQQFGDKSICRLCKVTTMSTPTVICIRCHFKYHQECIRTQNKEPQFQDGARWHCLSCIERMAKRKLKESEPQKKKKTNQILEFFQKTPQTQEDTLHFNSLNYILFQNQLQNQKTFRISAKIPNICFLRKSNFSNI